MIMRPNYSIARDILIGRVKPIETERALLSESGGRILAQELKATEDIPPFDRSPYDGYAVFSGDTEAASEEAPVTLRILEEVPAGGVPSVAVTPGTATKIHTGAPIPAGADAVVMYEKTRFTAETVTLFAPVKKDKNNIKAGEDVKRGQLLAECGALIDAGLAGTLASQGVSEPLVYRRPLIGVVSTGDEVAEIDTPLAAGKIRNTNRFSLEAALLREGMTPVYLGHSGDSVADICTLLESGLACCDAVLSTGGVSVGDYDLTPAAMEKAGVEMLFRGVNMKPGMACAYGIRDGKPVCGLSGNPAAAITNFYAVALPALRKLSGRRDFMPRDIQVTLANGFRKKSPATRLLRGRLDLSDGTVKMLLPQDQGNVVLSSLIACDVIAIVPAGSEPLEAGTKLKGFLI